MPTLQFDPTEFLRTIGGYGNTAGGDNGNWYTDLLKGTVPGTGYNVLNPLGPLQSLFGGNDQPSWKPFYDEQTGKYIWSDPSKRNPVPVTTVPSTTYKPSKQYRQTAESVRTLVDLLPYYSQAIAGQQIPDALAALASAQAVSPGYQQLQLDLLKQFGGPLADEGNKIALQNALASAERDKTVLEGPGKELIAKALEAYKTVDPEFFNTRTLTADKLAALMNSIDLSGGLSGSERSEIERSLGQEGLRRGTANAPSQLDTVSNAMRYGEAGRQRELQNRSELSKAIAAATAFLPTSRTGIDPFQVATGKSSVPNVGSQNFIGTTNPANNVANAGANSIFGGANQFAINNSNIQAQKDLNKKDWADYLNQVTSSIGNIASIAGGFI